MVSALPRFSLFLALPLLAALSACDTTKADERHEAGQVPGTAEFAPGATLSIAPGRASAAADGVVVARAASPAPEIVLTADAEVEARFRLTNVRPDAALFPPPAFKQTVGPTTVELVYRVPAEGLRIRVAAPGEGPARFAVISDLHTNLATFARFAQAVHAWRPDMVLCMGDLADHGEVEELDQMREAFDTLEVPFYTTLGNHDLMGEAAERFLETIGPTNLAFDVRGVRVVLADTAGAIFAPGAYGWLADALQREAGPALVLAHIPPLDPFGARNHGFSNRDDALRFVQAITEGGATHFFAGHIHSHIDYSMRGVPSTISGGGGGNPEYQGPGDHWLEVVVDPLSPTPVTIRTVELR